MELRKTVSIELDLDEHKILMDACYLITRIAKNIRKQGANGIKCNIDRHKKCFEEMAVWEIASAVEDLANVQYMYGRDWGIEITDSN